MKKTFLLVSALLAVDAYAQNTTASVGINTQTPHATLHIEAGQSVNKGIIIPRITAQEMKTMTAQSDFGRNQNAMLVYLKETMSENDRMNRLSNVSTVGYYYYDNTNNKWYPLQDLRLIGEGNHITQDAGVGGYGASVGTGINNIGIGRRALYSNTEGEANVAIGVTSLSSNTTGSNNIALGYSALNSNTTGGSNIALGYSALNSNTTGGSNIALGYRVLKSKL